MEFQVVWLQESTTDQPGAAYVKKFHSLIFNRSEEAAGKQTYNIGKLRFNLLTPKYLNNYKAATRNSLPGILELSTEPFVNFIKAEHTRLHAKHHKQLWKRSFYESGEKPIMFSYLSKKLEIASGANVRCLSWSGVDSYLACGCDNGLLKVLKIDTTPSVGTNDAPNNPKGYLATPTNISMNQTLEGHSSQIQVISWNNVHNKLTTSDSKGLIVVWMLYKGSWYEEMVNNRNKSTVRGLAWSSDGEKICIVYEDGGVIVGSADGNRLWSKELKGPGLTGVAWSSDANQILFTVGQSEVHVYDSNGSFSSKLALGAHKGPSSASALNIIAVRWRQQMILGEIEFPNLIVVFEKSLLYLMRGVNDEKPLVLEYNLAPTCAEWSTNGMYFALGGTLTNMKTRGAGDSELDQVLLFSAFGKPLHQIRVPTKNIMSLAWDAWSLRLGIGAGPHIYFANIRPFYKMAHYAERMFVYAFNRPDGSQHLGFWDEDKLNTQEIPGKVIDLKGNSDFLAVMTMSYGGMYNVAIVNAVGAPIDSLSILTMEPYTMCLTPSTLVCLATNAVLIWKYNVMASKKETLGISRRRERAFHIDEAPSVLGDSADPDQLRELADYLKKTTKDPTVAGAAVPHLLVVMRESGKFQMYSLPHGALVSILDVAAEMGLRPQRIFLNCDGTQMAMLDAFGVISMCSLTSTSMRGAGIAINQLDRKDVWDLIWAQDNPNLMCVMEKTRLYIYQNGVPEEPTLSSGYFLRFKDMKVTSALMDELIQDPERITQNTFAQFETKILREMQAMMDSERSLTDILDFVEENPHPHLYHLLAQSALMNLDFGVAEAAFVRSKDYAGIQFVKKVANIQDELVQQAEVSAFFEDFEKAESLYIEADRRDLANEMWRLLGDWNKVEKLSFSRQRPTEKVIRTMNLAKGDYYAEMLDWSKAKPHYEIAEEKEQLFLSSLILEDFAYLQSMIKDLPESHPLIPKIAAVFASLGRCQEAVSTYLICGMHEKAVDVAVKLNQWVLAMDLAHRYSVFNAGKVLLRYARYLIKQQKLMQVVQLFKTSNYTLAAAKILVMMALRELEAEELDAPYVKKLFVLSGLVGVEERPTLNFLDKKSDSRMSTVTAKPSAEGDDAHGELQFDSYIPKTFQPSKEVCSWMLANPWRGAEALHFYILCQKHLYTRKFENAARCAVQLQAYTDIIGDERVAAMIALTSANTGAFKTCSRALTTLEMINSEYCELGLSLFSESSPFDERPSTVECDKCYAVIPDNAAKCPECKAIFRLCTFTGRPLNYKPRMGVWICRVCSHQADAGELNDYPSCPLCSSPRNQQRIRKKESEKSSTERVNQHKTRR